jgi:hypothetical protein
MAFDLLEDCATILCTCTTSLDTLLGASNSSLSFLTDKNPPMLGLEEFEVAGESVEKVLQ